MSFYEIKLNGNFFDIVYYDAPKSTSKVKYEYKKENRLEHAEISVRHVTALDTIIDRPHRNR